MLSLEGKEEATNQPVALRETKPSPQKMLVSNVIITIFTNENWFNSATIDFFISREDEKVLAKQKEILPFALFDP